MANTSLVVLVLAASISQFVETVADVSGDFPERTLLASDTGNGASEPILGGRYPLCGSPLGAVGLKEGRG